MLAFGLMGYGLDRRWDAAALTAAIGIAVYLPIDYLSAIVAARAAPGWRLPIENVYRAYYH